MELKQKASLTGFRMLYILDILLKGPVSKNEILDILSKKDDLEGNITKETIGLDINTLKSAGFEIENTGKSNNYRYKINWSPIKLKLTKKEMQVLLNTRDAIIEIEDWEDIVKLYGLFKKISNFIEDEDAINELMNFGYFLNIDFEILKELNVLCKRKKEVKLLHKSQTGSIKEIAIKLKEIKYISSKLYVTGTSLSYPDGVFLRVDNIVKILKILPQKDLIKKPKAKNIIYKINPSIIDSVSLLGEERILKQNKNFIQIELKSYNNFMALQRLLGYGRALIDIKNHDIKKEYLKNLENMQKIYKENSK